jgi:hypothetical protein
MNVQLIGAFAFGTVVGWICYRTLRRNKESTISDLATVIGAVGGAAVLGLFPAQTDLFGSYGIGLAAGFFVYLIVSLVVAAKTETLSAVNEWLGDDQPSAGGRPPPNAQNAGRIPQI